MSKSARITVVAFLCLFLQPTPVWGASGDILPTTTGTGTVVGETTANETKATERRQSTVLIDATGISDPAVLLKQISSRKIRVINGGKEWSFSLDTTDLQLQKKRFVQFAGLELPLRFGAATDFPVKEKYVIPVPFERIIPYLEAGPEKELNRDKKDVTIRRENDQIVFDGTAEDGQKVSREAFVKTLGLSLEKDISTLQLPVIDRAGQVFADKSIQDLNIKELVSTGLSDFAGSPKNRVHNIGVGVRKFNGVVIKKGDEFSFNDHLGPVDGAHGFLPELVIKGPETIPEFGGGLCQVSSTMFRAALFRGLPILERRNHSYAVTYYKWPLGWGFDATIYPGAVDMRFKNDTPGDLLVQAYIEGTRVYYKFYGIKDSRKVDVSDSIVVGYRGPPAAVNIPTNALPAGAKRVKENAHTGLTAYFTRRVEYPDGNTTDEKFTSVYQARPAVYLVGASAPAPEQPAPTEQYYDGGPVGG